MTAEQLVHGVDLSSYNTVTSWPQVAKALGAGGFVMVKATEGAHGVSSTWRRYVEGARGVKLAVGSYHYGHPENDPEADAGNYVHQLRAAGWRTGADLPPALDIEMHGGKDKVQLTAWCRAFAATVDELLGLAPGMTGCGWYMNGDYYANRLDGRALHQGRWLWLAKWRSAAAWPGAGDRPAGAAIWQYTDAQRVAGISGEVDADVARLEDLRRMAPKHYPTPAKPPAEPKTPPATPPPVPKPTPPAPVDPVGELRQRVDALTVKVAALAAALDGKADA